MKPLQLLIGDKSLSSWSMRAWIVMKLSGLPFEEILVFLDRADTKEKLKKYSPSELVPCLIQGDLRIWDSLAISEYLAELAPDKNLWPNEPSDRAIARSYVSEIHSSFSSVRAQLSMDLLLNMQIRHLLPDTIKEIQRILFLRETALTKSSGPFLFGEFGIADAFYAPVVYRFLSYGIEINSPLAQAYISRVQEFPVVKEWVTAALKEKIDSRPIGAKSL
jgi:glutathione S-transferase